MKAVSQNVPDPGITRCLDLAQPARDVLVVGDAVEELLRALDQRGCSIVCLLSGSMKADEAAIFAAQVVNIPAGGLGLPDDLRHLSLDAVILCDPHDRLGDPSTVLREARELLREDGFVIAALGSPRFDIFTRAGYLVDGVDELPPGSAMGALLMKVRPSANRQTLGSTVTGDGVEALHIELEREQTARDQLLDALATAERSATDIQRKASDIAARRNEISKRNAELENAYDLQACDLLIERESRLRLQIALLLSQRAIDLAYRDAAQSETAWYSLFAQLESTRVDADKAFAEMRALLESARRDRDIAKAHVHRLTTSEAASNERAGELQGKVSELERQISDGGGYVKKLLRDIASKEEHARALEAELDAIRNSSLAEKAVMQEYANDVRERSERLTGEVAAAAERDRRIGEGLMQQVESLQRTLRETESRLDRENLELRGRVAAAEGALAAQTDAVIATMQAESAQISILVDTVQSSRFWRFKRWLNRLRRAVRS